MRKKEFAVIITVLALCLGTAACGGSSAAQKTQSAQQTAAISAADSTQTAAPAATTAPAVTKAPAATKAPTATKAPAATKAPTATKAPAATAATAQKYIGQPVSALYAAIGHPSSSDYAPSCLGDGDDGNLYYNGFVVYTYRENGVENVTAVG